MNLKAKARLLAKYEQSWWQAHHRKDKAKLTKMLILEHQLMHNVTKRQAEILVDLLVRAAFCHDKAEMNEDFKHFKLAKIEWKRTRNLLQQYFELLLEYKAERKK